MHLFVCHKWAFAVEIVCGRTIYWPNAVCVYEGILCYTCIDIDIKIFALTIDVCMWLCRFSEM